MSAGRSRTCVGHWPTCTHAEGLVACDTCLQWRMERGPVYCANLDDCAGPGCMDHLMPSAAARSQT